MPLKVQLKAVQGDMTGKTIVCEDGETILFGRSKDCRKGALPRDDESVSRRHFMLQVETPDIWAWDLDSAHGTLINDRKIVGGQQPPEKIALHDGDRIQAGEQVFELKIEGLPDAADHGVLEAQANPALNRQAGENQQAAAAVVEGGLPAAERREVRPEAQPEPVVIEIGGAPNPINAANERIPSGRRSPVPVAPAAGLPPQEKAAPSLGNLCLKSFDGPPVIPGYQIQKRLGRGGLGTTFMCRRERDDCPAIVKVVRVGSKVESRMLDLLREAFTTLCNLKHHNIVQIIDYGVSCSAEGSAFCFEMELCDLGDTQRLADERGGKIPPHEVYDFMLGVLAGLAHAHNHKIVHGNLKPSNVLLASGEKKTVAKAGDFALGRILQRIGLNAATSAGYNLGSLPFMPREQVKNPNLLEVTADVWSAGAIFYSLLVGKPPRDAACGEDLYEVALKGKIIPIRDHYKIVPKGLDPLLDLIDRALTPSPAERFPSGVEMYQCLRRIPHPTVIIVK